MAHSTFIRLTITKMVFMFAITKNDIHVHQGVYKTVHWEWGK